MQATVIHWLASDSDFRAAYADKLNPDDFGDLMPVFSLLKDWHDAGSTITPATIEQGCRLRNLPLDWQGISHAITKREEVAAFADMMIQERRRRTVIDVLKSALRKAGDTTGDPMDVIADILAMDGSTTGRGEWSIDCGSFGSEVFDAVISRLDDHKRRGLIFTQFQFLNNLTMGFEPGDLIIVSGRTGVGKSSFGQALCLNVGIKQSRETVIINSELSREQILIRAAASLSDDPEITVSAIRAGLTQVQLEGLQQQLEVLRDRCRLSVYKSPSLSLPKIRELVRKAAVKDKAKLLLVDYLGRQDRLGQKAEIWELLQQAAMELKTLAQKYGVIIILIAQLLDDGSLASAKGIEREADLHIRLLEIADAVDFKVIKKADITGIDPRFNVVAEVKKSRNSGKGLTFLQYDGAKMRFYEDPVSKPSIFDAFSKGGSSDGGTNRADQGKLID